MAHERAEAVFGTAAGTIELDDETFDDPDPEIVVLFDGSAPLDDRRAES